MRRFDAHVKFKPIDGQDRMLYKGQILSINKANIEKVVKDLRKDITERKKTWLEELDGKEEEK